MVTGHPSQQNPNPVWESPALSFPETLPKASVADEMISHIHFGQEKNGTLVNRR
jgi:hypothetical protein